MDKCFLLKADSGLWALLTTLLLSHMISVGPLTGIPNIHSLKHRASTALRQVCMAMNSDPKVEVSTMFCCLLYQRIVAWLHNIIYPVCDHLMMRFPAWSESMYAVTLTGSPSSLGMSAGSSSSTSP